MRPHPPPRRLPPAAHPPPTRRHEPTPSPEQAHLCTHFAGYHLGVLNTSEAHVEVDLRSGEAGASLVAVLLVGATLGSLVAGRLADRLGPR